MAVGTGWYRIDLFVDDGSHIAVHQYILVEW